MISMEYFKKIDLKVAKIQEVCPHPNADKLYVIKIDTGTEQKQIVAGIKNFYTPGELLGKLIVIVDNLEPCVLRGVKSEGMLLAASSGDQLSIIIPERPISAGAQVK